MLPARWLVRGEPDTVGEQQCHSMTACASTTNQLRHEDWSRPRTNARTILGIQPRHSSRVLHLEKSAMVRAQMVFNVDATPFKCLSRFSYFQPRHADGCRTGTLLTGSPCKLCLICFALSKDRRAIQIADLGGFGVSVPELQPPVVGLQRLVRQVDGLAAGER